MTEPFIFRIARTFDAPVDQVWHAWTDKELSARWFGPKGCTIIYKKFNIKPGGEVRYSMEYQGFVMHGKANYTDIIDQKKLVSLAAFTDEAGDRIVPHPGSPNWPKRVHSTVTFRDLGEKTEVLVEWQAFEATELEAKTFEMGAGGMALGWGGSFDQLGKLLATLKS